MEFLRFSRFTIPLLAVLALLTATSFAVTRPPAVAGGFYPADPGELRGMIEKELNQVTGIPKIDGQIVALIVPHAGLIYSGPVAAYSYKLLDGSGIDKVILCGPSHRYGFRGVSVYGPGVEWQTPLGVVDCNDKLCQKLIDYDPSIDVIPAAQGQEHSLEVQLPFLQTVLSNFTLVPAEMGYQSPTTIKILGKALSSLPFDKKTVLIASSDWQHYKTALEGWQFDSLGIECVKSLDPDRLEKYLSSDKTEACGGGPIVSVMRAAIAHGANRVKILKHGDSGDVTGDKSSVVGYLAAVLYKSDDESSDPPGGQETKASAPEQLPEKFQLTGANKRELLYIARESIKEYLKSGKAPKFDVSSDLEKPGAGFVTLEKAHNLRGCIGYTEAIMPLYQTISDCAIKAALQDYRFPPVKAPELDSLHIEISVLTPLQKVNSLDEIEVGRDGLMISKGRNRGLLLPQVATEYGWNRDEFLMQTCRKAGLPVDAYKSHDAAIYKFQAVIFGE
jgi:AmmeMemoRadiSam system protein B/AmmeMemoRadiSam system protein A